MLDRFEEYTNIPQGMATLIQQGILTTDQAHENEDKFTAVQSFFEENGYESTDLKKPMCSCGCKG